MLIVITLLALSMVRSFGLQEQLSDAAREQHRALEAAASAEQHAEAWLLSDAVPGDAVACAAREGDADTGRARVCSNELASLVADVTSVPWTAVGGGEVGIDDAPAAGAEPAPAGFAPPRYYIVRLGPSPTGRGTVYRIEAFGYGASRDAVAVIESTYLVEGGVRDLGTP